MNQKIFVLLVILLLGCSTSPPPPPTPLATITPAIEPVRPTESLAPTDSPSSPNLTNDDLLQIFPLKQGAQWVYVQDAYETIPNDALPERTDRGITATVRITDTVTETQTRNEYYAARLVRETQIVTTSLPLESLGEYGQEYFGGGVSDTRWFIVDGNRVYSSLEPLNWDAAGEWQLAYQFPLAAAGCWHPDPSLPQECNANDPPQWLYGSRQVESLAPQRTPAGNFDECFSVHEIYNSGDTIQRFCPGIGIVGEDYDHSGTPFGYHSQLVEFTPGQ